MVTISHLEFQNGRHYLQIIFLNLCKQLLNFPCFSFRLQSLMSTTAFGLGAKYFAYYEEEGVGVQWSNIYISPVEDDPYNLLMVTVMMLIDSMIYGLLVWYIENVHPGTLLTT